MRAVATFLRPQVVQTVLFTDPEAFGQVRATGHLDLGALVGDAAVGVVSGHYGGRLAGASEQLFGTQLADPVARWLLPRLGNGLGWGASDAATQVAGGGSIDPVEVGGAVAVATAGGAPSPGCTCVRSAEPGSPLHPGHRNGYRRPSLRCSITSPSTTAPHPPGTPALNPGSPALPCPGRPAQARRRGTR